MTPQGFQAIAEHWQLVALLLGMSALAGSLIRGTFAILFWNDARVERLLQKAIDMTMASRAFAEAVERISASFTSKVEAQILDLRKRDDERASSVGRAHGRIDDLATDMNAKLFDLAKRLPGDRQ